METFIAFLDRLFSWIPRLYFIRATHGAVCWRADLRDLTKALEIEEMDPGLYWYWPITTEIESIVTARRPVDIPTMSILTKDGRSVIVSATVVSRINDVKAALGERNWDVDSTLVDITQNVIFRAVRGRTFAELLAEPTETFLNRLTAKIKAEVKKFGIHVESVLAQDFDLSRTYRVLGSAGSVVTPNEEEE